MGLLQACVRSWLHVPALVFAGNQVKQLCTCALACACNKPKQLLAAGKLESRPWSPACGVLPLEHSCMQALCRGLRTHLTGGLAHGGRAPQDKGLPLQHAPALEARACPEGTRFPARGSV